MKNAKRFSVKASGRHGSHYVKDLRMHWRKYASKLSAMSGTVSGTAPQPCRAHIPVCKHLTRVIHARSPTCLTINLTNDSLWNSLMLLPANTSGLRIYEKSRTAPILCQPCRRTYSHRVLHTLYQFTPCTTSTRDSTLKQFKKKKDCSEHPRSRSRYLQQTRAIFLEANYRFIFYNKRPFSYVTYRCSFFHIYFTSLL